jgi:hypothetical protein
VPGIFAVPMLSLLDISRAVAELNRVIKAGARLVHLCPGPAGGRSPADPLFDPFWVIADESGGRLQGNPLEHHRKGRQERRACRQDDCDGLSLRLPNFRLSASGSPLGCFRAPGLATG